MPFCSILGCKNDSRRKNINNGGVTYHRYPKNPSVKEKWIDATGRINWMPSKHSTVCSEHFLEEDFLTSTNGHRFIQRTALPSIKIVKFFDQIQYCNDTADSSKKQCDSESSDFESQPKQNFIQKEGDIIPGQFHFEDISVQFKNEPVENIEATVCSNCSTPRIKKLQGQLRYCKDKIVRLVLKVKRLQSKNRTLQKKINNMEIQGKLEWTQK